MSCLGIDVGATKCAWEFVDESGQRSSGVVHGGAQAAELGVAATVDVLEAQVGSIRGSAGISSLTRLLVAVAGAGTDELRVGVQGALESRLGCPVHVVSDVLAAAATCLLESEGVLLWAGTGSFAVGRDSDGRLRRCGGRGPLLSDVGSGFDLVRTAAVAAVDGEDGIGPATDLTPALAEFFGCPPLRLGVAMAARSSAQVAAALPVVLRVAAGGDAVAQSAVYTGTSRLCDLAVSVMKLLGLSPASTQLWLGGGVLAHGSLLHDRLLVHAADRSIVLPPRAVPCTAAAAAADLGLAVAMGREPQTAWVRDGAP